jgi:endogenous inhibitor of DNA gyrase (YacG/DUF329 family)
MSLYKCSNCKKEIIKENNTYFPFCSSTCRKVDFYGWITESYKIPCEDTDEDDSYLDAEEQYSEKN